MKNIFSFQNQKGFTMIEVIVSCFILTTAIIGSYFIFYQILSTITVISSRLTAAYLAQEGIEIVRNIRDTNWVNARDWKGGLNNCGNGCEADYKTSTSLSGSINTLLNIDSDGFYSYSAGSATKFKRKITIDSSVTNVLDIIVSVSWNDRGKNYNFDVENYLYNWKVE